MTRRKLQASTNIPINPADNLIWETTKNTIGVLHKQQQQHTLRPPSLHLHTAIQTSPLYKRQWPVVYTSFLLYRIPPWPSCSFTTQKIHYCRRKSAVIKLITQQIRQWTGPDFLNLCIAEYFSTSISQFQNLRYEYLQVCNFCTQKTCVLRNSEMSRSESNVPSNS